jgi:glycosyltransferase involved in cell wall biosynthesis
MQVRRIVLFLSRFDRKKGLDLLLPAFASLRAQCPDAALVLAGSGDKGLEAQLREQSIALGIADHVFWPGFLSGSEKAAAFADADVFVLPSYSENFGIAVVEAMAAGCPAVVSDQVAIHDDIKSAGAGVVVRCDARELAEALSFALSDAAARARMGSNGRQLSLTRYSLDSVAAKLAAAYQTIAS